MIVPLRRLALLLLCLMIAHGQLVSAISCEPDQREAGDGAVGNEVIDPDNVAERMRKLTERLQRIEEEARERRELREQRERERGPRPPRPKLPPPYIPEFMRAELAKQDEFRGPVVVGPYFGDSVRVVRSMLELWSSGRGAGEVVEVRRIDFTGAGSFRAGAALHTGMIVTEEATLEDRSWLEFRYPPEGPQPGVFKLGQRRMAVIAHPGNPLREMTLDELGLLLRDRSGQPDADEPAPEWATDLQAHDLGDGSWGRHILRWKSMERVMEHDGFEVRTHDGFRPDIRAWADASAVVAAVRKDPVSIGFIPYVDQDLQGVRVLLITGDDNGRNDPLEVGARFQRWYPLAEPLFLYVAPEAPDAVWEFARFCVSPDGSRVLEEMGFMTPHREWRDQADGRVSQVRAGQGEPVRAVATGGLRALVPRLGIEHVRAREVMRLLTSGAASGPEAVAAFVSGAVGQGPELLFVMDHELAAARQAHGAGLDRLGAESEVLGGRAVAIIVNAVNEVDELGIDELREIFLGRTTEWSDLGADGDEAAVPGPGAIRCFGLAAEHPGAELMRRERVAPPGVDHITALATTEAVVAAVSVEPGAIGFVDLAALPTEGQTVKVLAIRAEAGGEAVSPVLEHVVSGAYPLGDRLHLHVHPQAGEAARGFAEFLKQGVDETLPPYMDTREKMAEAYREVGVVGDW